MHSVVVVILRFVCGFLEDRSIDLTVFSLNISMLFSCSSMFYVCMYICISLVIINYICIIHDHYTHN